MVAKRALVVDDSKSARAFLAKLLQEQQVEVDTAETAEQALDYLSRHRPDVIFMDHLMPGMDGFQAVQAIKTNPRTAGIPVLMYTSQEGELYLGQARALGAVGVLPKNVGAADVRAVLQQLDLSERAEPVTMAAQKEVLDAAVAALQELEHDETAELPVASVDIPSPVEPPAAAPSVDHPLREEIAALRQHVAESLDAHGQRTLESMRALLIETLPPPAPPPVIEPEEPRHSPVPWLLALAASVAAAVFGTLLWQNQQQGSALRTELADAKATIALLTARLGPAQDGDEVDPGRPAATTASADRGEIQQVVRVPFGEPPLSGARIEQLRDFVARAAQRGQKGTVEVRRYTGRFCLAGNRDGYALAEAAVPYPKCDLVADAADPVLGNALVESVAFANALAELRKQYGAQVSIDVGAGRGDATPYPEAMGGARATTAGEWNSVAESNNRVEMRWHPAP